MSRVLGLAVVAACSLGCGGKKAAVKVTTPQPHPTSTTPTATAQVTPTLGVSEDLAKSCTLRFNSLPDAPKFAYDGDELAPPDRDVLEQIATCLTAGPLKGRSVRLVGRADPRGTTEYNLGLGTRRASAVQTYLHRLGVGPKQLAATTRGALDANGNDEQSWHDDRRVDLELVN